MNPAKLNHRIKFAQEESTQNEYGGSVMELVPVVCSDIAPADVTWGDLRPVKQYNQLAIEAGASVLNGDKILIIRYRSSFTPSKSMLFQDITEGVWYTIHAILPYDEKQKNDVFQDAKFVYVVGAKRT